ncbi:MAG TPA: SCO family protein [Fimbriimonadaceae bacterium]|nr:SCO family protein [Fimbriimonadaceae bacterium]
MAVTCSAIATAQVTEPVYNRDGTQNKIAGIGVTQKLGADVPLDLTFKDETGADVRLSQFFGHRPVLLSLVFYKCKGMCSLETEGLIESFTKMSAKKEGARAAAAKFVAQGGDANGAYTLLGSDVDILSVSIDPNEGPADAADKRKEILSNFKDDSATKGWHFLTGDLGTLNKLVSAVGFQYTYNSRNKAISHPTAVILLSPAGKVNQYFFGTAYPEKPLHDGILLASTNVVGPQAVPILLGCLSHDAMTGKYTVNVEQTLRVMCVLTVIVLAVSVWRMGHRKAKTEEGLTAHVNHG